MPTLLISGRKFSYKVTRKGISSLRLKLNSATTFSVSAPFLMPQFLIEKFINDHQDWILKNIPAPKPIKNTLSILDDKFLLITNKTAHDSVVVYESEKKIYLNTRLQTENHIKKLLDKKLRVIALKLIKQHLNNYDFDYSRVSVRNQSSRFGSCSSSNNLSFNWQIILFPLPIFQHILLHELAHTVVKNHSVKFWNLLSQYDHNYRTHRRWLKTEANKFMIFS
jgi:predicted metal-dependent hydrolase